MFLVVVFFYAYYSAGVRAPNTPGGAGPTTLEWTLPSPPAFHSYEKLPKFEEAAHH
jgi:cytochrome c oxidase subunit 1